MLCCGFIAVTNDFYKKHERYVFDYAVECVSSNGKWAWHLGVALDDFANVRKFSRSAPEFNYTKIKKLVRNL